MQLQLSFLGHQPHEFQDSHPQENQLHNSRVISTTGTSVNRRKSIATSNSSGSVSKGASNASPKRLQAKKQRFTIASVPNKDVASKLQPQYDSANYGGKYICM